MRFKIDWAGLIVGRKFTVFALFYFVFEGNFPSTSPRGAYIWRGDLTEGFLRYEFGGLIFGGAYTWRGLFSEFYGISSFVSIFNTFPVNQFRSRELRKLHFRESNEKKFPGGAFPRNPPRSFGFHHSTLAHYSTCIQYFQKP